MAKIYYEKDANPATIRDKKVAVLGFGSQGHAHALNLKDSGVDVRVGLLETSKSRSAAQEAGLEVGTAEEVSAWADVLMFCVPDVPMRKIYAEEVAPNIRPGMTLLFAHGFNVHYGLIEPPAGVNVAMVAPKGPGHRLRAEVVAGNGMPALVAVHQDTGDALEVALGYAWGIGCAKAGVLQTTFKEETETDLFGEQAVLCGGMSALIRAGFETLVEAGYQPEAAYFECLHETKLIVDLIYEGGLTWMRHSVSDTAEWGDFVSGPRVIGEPSKAAMREILAEIQDGRFAERWVQENENGRPNLERMRDEARTSDLERVGKDLRAMMNFLQEKEPPQ